VRAVIDTGRGAGRPRFFSSAMTMLSGMDAMPSRWSTGVDSRATPTITRVPPGARRSRKDSRASVNGRWWTTATQVMTSYDRSPRPVSASATV
jgi:hypothetical protein